MRLRFGALAAFLLASSLASPLALPAQAAAPLASHRAVYDLSLARASSKSQIIDAAGRLVIEWQDSCEGFTTNQRFYTQFGNADGGSIVSDLFVSSWESQDGANFRFNLTSTANGQSDERARGQARRATKAGDGKVAFDEPRGEALDLPRDAVFPTEHMLLLIDAARKGEHMFERPLFDGSYEHGLSYVSAFIGAKRPAGAKEIAAKAAPKSGADLLKGWTWPVRMAFYPYADQNQALPDYEFSFVLHENGVATDLQFDYGDFVIGAKLASIEALPGCDASPSHR